jgi:hypothetical protein
MKEFWLGFKQGFYLMFRLFCVSIIAIIAVVPLAIINALRMIYAGTINKWKKDCNIN